MLEAVATLDLDRMQAVSCHDPPWPARRQQSICAEVYGQLQLHGSIESPVACNQQTNAAAAAAVAAVATATATATAAAAAASTAAAAAAATTPSHRFAVSRCFRII